MEPQVQRVRDVAAHRRAEVGLQVLVVVPAESRHAIAALEAERAQSERELLGAAREVGVRVAVEAPVGEARHDLLLREERLPAAQDRGDRQLVVHDQAVHHSPFPKPWRLAMSSGSTRWPSRST